MTPTPTTPTRNSRSASSLADCTMIDEPPSRAREPTRPSTPEGSWRRLRSGRRTRFKSKSYNSGRVISNGSESSFSVKPHEPIDKAADPLPDRCFGTKSDGALEIGDVGAGFRHVARLHRPEFPRRRLADGRLDQSHDLAHLDRLAVADVVDVPGRPARGWVRRLPGPGRIGRRRPRHQPHHRLDRVVDIGEVPP